MLSKKEYEEAKKELESDKPIIEKKEEIERLSPSLIEVYYLIIDVLKYYCDIEEKYYSLISLWIIGTYYHDEFPTYPYLFFNAMRGSGKSRLLRLVVYLSKDGSMLNSLTEAVLFRTTGTLGIDEFEGIGRKGNEALKELLNSAYKKGITIKRMKKQKSLQGEEMVVEEFSVYRPILMANISGMEEVLGDRCLQIILSKSGNPKITKKVEIYENDTNIQKIKKFSKGKCRLCRDVALVEMYKAWNEFIDTINVTNVTNITNITNVTNVTNNNIDINKDLFNILNDSGIDGRNLELMFPLIVLAYSIDENILNEVLETLKDIVSEKKREDLVENIDVAVYDFVSQQLIGRWYILKELLKEFKHFSQMEDEWINERWFGKALKRLSLVKDKKKQNYGKLYILDIDKAQEKIKMFKTKDI